MIKTKQRIVWAMMAVLAPVFAFCACDEDETLPESGGQAEDRGPTPEDGATSGDAGLREDSGRSDVSHSSDGSFDAATDGDGGPEEVVACGEGGEYREGYDGKRCTTGGEKCLLTPCPGNSVDHITCECTLGIWECGLLSCGQDAGYDAGADATYDAGPADIGLADAHDLDIGNLDAGTADGGMDGGHAGDAGHPDGGPNPQPPSSPVKLIFIHHSTGENWLGDDHGELGTTLRDNNYFVSDTNYGWGPNGIGDTTDIGHWFNWFRGSNAAAIMSAVFAESGQHSSYSRLAPDPGGQNEIVMFKSCFPNSALKGNPADPVPAIGSNPLKGQDAYSAAHTVANAKGIYTDILEYFKVHQEKLFVVVTAPPLQDPTHSSNARAFNQWLVDDWLLAYPHDNVFVFDFYNVLTTNGGDSETNDLGQETGNHHRWWKGAIQHKIDGDDDGNGNVLEYDSWGDDHPTPAGGRKASVEFAKLLNTAWHKWSGE
ncbi:MAG: hypothetical protein HY897_08355 [Deltaproteobacteria bacterium]|nr:hypothetical protein [Deltaproteobacteria bacterium]